MNKMAVTRVDKNEFFLTKRTHNNNLGARDVSCLEPLPSGIAVATATAIHCPVIIVIG